MTALPFLSTNDNCFNASSIDMPLIYVQSHRNGQKYNKYNTTNGQINGKAVGFINNYNSRINDFNVENACMTKKLRK